MATKLNAHELDELSATRFHCRVDDLRPWHLDDPFFQAPPASASIGLDHLFADADIAPFTMLICDAGPRYWTEAPPVLAISGAALDWTPFTSTARSTDSPTAACARSSTALTVTSARLDVASASVQHIVASAARRTRAATPPAS